MLVCGGQVRGADPGAPVFLWLCSFSPFLRFGGRWEETRRGGNEARSLKREDVFLDIIHSLLALRAPSSQPLTWPGRGVSVAVSAPKEVESTSSCQKEGE